MIEIQNLVKTYDDFKAVDGLTFSVGAGEIVGLVGPNGAGKTTTLRCLSGIIPPTSGRVAIDGHDLDREPVEAKRKLAFVPDEPHLFEHSYGLGQVLPSTALWMVRSPTTFPILTRLRELVLDASKETSWHGEKKVNKWFQNKEVGIELAAAYLGYQYRRYSEDLDKAVAAYNAGSARYKEGKFVNEGYVIKFHRALHKLSHD